MEVLSVNRIVFLGLVALLVASFAIPAVAQEVELEFVHWFVDQADQAEWERVIRAFEEENPNIKVQINYMSDYFQKIPVLLASGNLPDVLMVSVAFSEEWARAGVLKNLQPFIDRELNVNDYFVPMFADLRLPPREPSADIYSFPFSWLISGIYFNKDTFRERGVAFPTENDADWQWTWQETADIARRFSRDVSGDGNIDRWGISSPAGMSNQLHSMIHAWGGRVLAEDRRRADLDDPETLDALQFMIDLSASGVGTPPDVSAVNAFRDGHLAMIDLGTNYIVRYNGVLDFDWDIAVMPSGPQRRVSYSGPDSVGIADSTPHPQESWKLLRYIVDHANFGGGRIPMNRALATSEEWLSATPYPSRKEILFDMAPDGMGASFGSRWIQWWGAASAEIAPAFRGERSPQEALEAAATVIDATLEDAYR